MTEVFQLSSEMNKNNMVKNDHADKNAIVDRTEWMWEL